MKDHDPVNHPRHYTGHPSGVEAITITEHMGFCLGNAMKYIWRADMKNGLEDLEKAKWYIEREIAKRKFSDTSGLGRAEAPSDQPVDRWAEAWRSAVIEKAR